MNRLELLERDLRGLRAELRALQRAGLRPPMRRRLARLAPDPDTDVYPTRSDVAASPLFWVMPIDGEPSASEPVAGVDSDDRHDDAPFQAYNLNHPLVYPVEDQIVFVERWQGVWYMAPAVGESNRCTGLLTGALATTDSTFEVDHVEPLCGLSPVAGELDVLTIRNTHEWEGDPSALCRFEWNHSELRWEAYQITCPSGY